MVFNFLSFFKTNCILKSSKQIVNDEWGILNQTVKRIKLVYVKFLSITKKVSSSNKTEKYLQATG